jgi:phage baseplate assembly protein W
MNVWEITNGDITISNGSFATITAYGSNKFHPRYGSVFDNFIGQPAGPGTDLVIKNEFQRIIQNYMKIQLAKMQAASNAGLASPYSQSEIVNSIGAISVQQSFSTFSVTGSVTTLTGQQLPVVNNVSN